MNEIEVRGAISHVTLRDTSLFMTVKEEGQHGNTQTVKAYCPNDLKNTPEVWKANFQHLEKGVSVIVKGRLSFDRETVFDQSSGQHVPVRHPTQDRDLYAPYIWAFRIDVLFNPALHTKRTAEPREAAQRAPAPRPPAPPRHDDDGLPPIPSADIPWNAGH